jgi:hypothetical protein
VGLRILHLPPVVNDSSVPGHYTGVLCSTHFHVGSELGDLNARKKIANFRKKKGKYW